MKTNLLLACITAIASVATVVFGAELTPQEKMVKSITGAKLIAQRNVVETVFGSNLEYWSSISGKDGSTFRNNLKSQTKVNDVRGIRFATEYDAKRDIAIVTAELDLAKIEDLAPAWKNAGSLTIRRVGFCSCTPDSVKMIQCLRAAEMDAYRNLFEQVSGFSLDSKTKLKDQILVDDQIASQCAGCLFAAKTITDPADKDKIAWSDESENASCVVTVELVVKDLEAAIGHKLLGCTADIIRVKGKGLPNREVKEEPVKEKIVVVEKPVEVVVEKKVVIESEPKVQKVDSTVLQLEK